MFLRDQNIKKNNRNYLEFGIMTAKVKNFYLGAVSLILNPPIINQSSAQVHDSKCKECETVYIGQLGRAIKICKDTSTLY